MNNSISLRLPNNWKFLPMTLQFIAEYAKNIGFSAKALTQIEMAAEEGISNVLKHAFSPSEEAHFDIYLATIPTGISISIRDQGVPFDPESIQYNQDTLEGLGSFVMNKMMDQIQYINHGKAGKELKMIKYFEEGTVEYTTESDQQQNNTPTEHTYVFRRFEDKDAIEVSRCAYESYGYTYAYEHIYFPERVKSLNRSGDLISIVAVADDGVVAGHMALVKVDGYDSLYEIGLAMTKQNYRGGNIFSNLLKLIYQEIDRRGIHAVFGQCVTTHTFSQSGPVKMGMIPTALLPAYVPDDIAFKNIAENEQKRTAVLIVNKILKQEAPVNIYLPERYSSLASDIYQQLAINRTIHNISEYAAPEHTEAHLSINANLRMAKINFLQFGEDFHTVVKGMIHQIKKEKVTMAEAFVNISHPDAIVTIEKAEALGFRFTGLLPGSPTGDIAILQYLNGILTYVEDIKVVEPAQHLLTFIEQQFD